MRLIDADSLIMNLDDRYSLRDISREYRDTVVYELENAPTIDPSKPKLTRLDLLRKKLEMNGELD